MIQHLIFLNFNSNLMIDSIYFKRVLPLNKLIRLESGLVKALLDPDSLDQEKGKAFYPS